MMTPLCYVRLVIVWTLLAVCFITKHYLVAFPVMVLDLFAIFHGVAILKRFHKSHWLYLKRAP